ncbi:hypothetical protein CEXT_620701 [Caerostris extrusa]|uniref:Pre-C2HC domain-containing protein n=1 Tax=Caerostris extrusa TaxID=172846 RepID=A0AAV4WEV2_CAEEX|nr:hypothetical protein CEXT_620701 [Caerostris extrusa]
MSVKVVIRELPANIDTKDIEVQLTHAGLVVHKILKLSKFPTKGPMPLFYVQMKQNGNSETAYKFTEMLGGMVFGLNLLQPCSKKEDSNILKPNGLDTIDKFSQDNLAIAYTDGTPDKFFNKGGAGIFFLLPNGSKYHLNVNTDLIDSNFTSELIAIKEVVALYLNDPNISGLTDGVQHTNTRPRHVFISFFADAFFCRLAKAKPTIACESAIGTCSAIAS